MGKGLGLWKSASLGACLGFLAAPNSARAADVSFKAEQYQTNVDTKITKAEGGVKVFLDDQEIQSERMVLDGGKSHLRQEGKVLYRRGDLTVEAESSDFDLKTGLGVFRNGILRIGTYFYLEGLELEAVGRDLYRAKHGKLTTCKDCPQSWSVTGVDLEMRVEGYAEIHHALVQVKDIPIAYAPILVFPVKTKRQSGFLIPQFSYIPDLGSEFYTPYFWAHGESADTTLTYHYFTKGGSRISSDSRYRFSNRTWFDARTSYLHNAGRMAQLPDHRYSYVLAGRAEFSPGFVQRFTGELASDGAYTTSFEAEFPSAGYPTLANDLSLAWQNPNFYGLASIRFNKDNLSRNYALAEATPATMARITSEELRGEGSINSLPATQMGWPAYPLGGPLFLSLEARTLSLQRRGSAVDPGTLWIRTGHRGSLIGRLEAPMVIGGFLNYRPAIETRGDLYGFPSEVATSVPNAASSAARGRIMLEQRVSASFDRIFDFQGEGMKALRHSIEPFVAWSYSPPDARTGHPFFSQSGAPRFDLFDPTDEVTATAFSTTSEEQRLRKHHFLTYGVATRFVGRYGQDRDRSYREFLGASIRQDIDLITGRFGRFIFVGTGAYGGFSVSSEIAFEPSLQGTEVRNGIGYSGNGYGVGATQTLIGDSQRQYGFSGSVNFLRPWYATAGVVFDARDESVVTRRIVEWNALVGFDGGESKCFYLGLSFERPATQRDMSFRPKFGIVINDSTKNTLF